MHHHYKPAKFHFSDAQLHKIKKGHKVRLQHHQIGEGPHTLFLHPMQHEKVSAAHRKGKGVDMIISEGEMHHTMESGAQGTGIWDTIKSGLSTAWNKVGKPVLSGIGDAIAYSNPELAPIREGVRNLTGVGLHGKKHTAKKHHEMHHYDSSDSEMHHAHKKHPAHKKHHKHKKHPKHGNGLYL